MKTPIEKTRDDLLWVAGLTLVNILGPFLFAVLAVSGFRVPDTVASILRAFSVAGLFWVVVISLYRRRQITKTKFVVRDAT